MKARFNFNRPQQQSKPGADEIEALKARSYNLRAQLESAFA